MAQPEWKQKGYQSASQMRFVEMMNNTREALRASGADERTIAARMSNLVKAYSYSQYQRYRSALSGRGGGSSFYGGAMSAGMGGAGSLASSASGSTAIKSGPGMGTAVGGSSMITGIAPSGQSAAQKESIEAGQQAAREATTTAQKAISSEIATQKELAPIRQRRQSMLEQQVKAMRRQTGRRALLSSPTGGAGFFGGYFK